MDRSTTLHTLKTTLLLLLFAFLCVLPASAQSDGLKVTAINTDNLPEVQLTLAGTAPDGSAIDPQQPVTVQHNNTPVNAQIVGTESAGSLTLFVVDLPPGVSDQIPAIGTTIANYADAQYMQEGVDYVGIYQISEDSVTELLPPAQFHNSVRNRITEGLPVSDGATRLFDNMNDLLERIDDYRPNPDMPVSIVLFSDGTDGLSTTIDQTTIEKIPELAASKGVNLHTVWLNNTALTLFVELGQDNLRIFSSGTGGLALDLSNAAELNSMYAALKGPASLIVAYTIPELLAGTFPVNVSFPNVPNLPAVGTQVEVKSTVPPLTIDLPAEQQAISLSNIDEPIDITFPTSYDASLQEVTEAQLVVNGLAVAEIPPASLNRFTASVPLQYGSNDIRIVYRDGAGTQFQSQPLTMDVSEGADEIPEELVPAAEGGFFGRLFSFLAILLLILLILAGLYYLYRMFQRNQTDKPRTVGATTKENAVADYPSQTDGARRKARTEEAQFAPPPSGNVVDAVDEGKTVVSAAVKPDMTTQISSSGIHTATIDVLDSISKVETPIDITRAEFLVGRSPNVDLSFPSDPTVSRIHATIVRDGDIFRVYDEQSTSGTYVNDREVPEYGLQLANGDEIHLGAVHLRFTQKK